MKIALKFRPGKGSAGAAKSGMKLLAPYRTRQPATGKLSRGKMKTYLVKGTVTVLSKYITTNPKSKQRKYNDKEFEDKPKYSLRIEATSKQEAEQQFRAQATAALTVAADDEDTEKYKSSRVSNIDVSFLQESPGWDAAVNEANTPMRRSMPVKYGFIPEDAKHQNCHENSSEVYTWKRKCWSCKIWDQTVSTIQNQTASNWQTIKG